jgi:glycosyltransferase involved in cell wall biosynthesis
MIAPAISVLMPLHNASAFLREAVASVLEQTFDDFELIIVDDGSTDDTAAILRDYTDPRIRVLNHASNRGIVESLNDGLAAARGAFIARMDGDDICHPERLARQWLFMQQHGSTVMCGTAVKIIGTEATAWVQWFDAEDVRIALLFESPICHPTAMFRSDVLQRAGLRYGTEFPHAEDYAMWVALSEYGACANVPEVLFHYRAHSAQISARNSVTQAASIRRLQAAVLARLHIVPSQREWRVHDLFGQAFNPLPRLEMRMSRWRKRLVAANRRYCLFDDQRLQRQLEIRENRATKRITTMMAQMSPPLRFRWRLIGALR